MLYKNETEFQFLISIKECLVTVKEGGKKRKEKKKRVKGEEELLWFIM